MPIATTAPAPSDAAHSSAASSAPPAGHDAVDQPERERLLGLARDGRSRSAPWLRAGPTSRGEPLRAARAREDAELDLGEAEARAVAGDAQVARQRELEPAAEREPFDRGDHRPRDRRRARRTRRGTPALITRRGAVGR